MAWVNIDLPLVLSCTTAKCLLALGSPFPNYELVYEILLCNLGQAQVSTLFDTEKCLSSASIKYVINHISFSFFSFGITNKSRKHLTKVNLETAHKINVKRKIYFVPSFSLSYFFFTCKNIQ